MNKIITKNSILGGWLIFSLGCSQSVDRPNYAYVLYRDEKIRGLLKDWYDSILDKKSRTGIDTWVSFDTLDEFETSPRKLIVSDQGVFSISEKSNHRYYKYKNDKISYNGLAITLRSFVENKLNEISDGVVELRIDLNEKNEMTLSINSRCGFIFSKKELTKGTSFVGSIRQRDEDMYLYCVDE